jgi:hypothetical protein
MKVAIKSDLIRESFYFESGSAVQISIVAYGYPTGMPARFCAGLVPAADLASQLKLNGFKPIIRVVDPSPIANYCNGWPDNGQLQSSFQKTVSDFFSNVGVKFFFDEAERLSEDAIKFLRDIGSELESPSDKEVSEIVERLRESGRRHGGEAGAANTMIYMAAHPFSWLDMYHPLVWKRFFPRDGCQFVNLMSKSEERFSKIRKFLKEKRPDLRTGNNPIDSYMAICDTPCYIPLEGEPGLSNLENYGYDWCLERYYKLRKDSSNHKRAYKDFKALMLFLGIETAV